MYLIFHVTLHDHLIEESSEFIDGWALWYDTTLISLVTITIVIVKICFYFVT